MKKIALALALLFTGGLAAAQQSGHTPVTLPDGVVVKAELPGAPRGNETSDKRDNDNKVYICHATSAVDSNGFVIVHVSAQAAEAHLRHEHATAQGNGQGNARRDQVSPEMLTSCGRILPN